MALYRRRKHAKKTEELMLVPMIDIFSVMVTFLLMTAVFTRLSIIQLDLPSNGAGGAPSDPVYRLEVIVKKDGLTLSNGGREDFQNLPLENGQYPFARLAEVAVEKKAQHADVEAASVLMSSDVEYDYLVQAMDAIRSIDAAAAKAHGYAGGTPDAAGRVDLFPKVAVGNAPGEE